MSVHDERPAEQTPEQHADQRESRPRYEPPRITKMSEEDVLKSFQVTGAAASWWAM